MCIFTLKQVLEYYRNHSSPAFVCFLDASKAFNRINHWNLLDKLQKTNISSFILRFFAFFFSQKEFSIKGDDSVSVICMLYMV